MDREGDQGVQKRRRMVRTAQHTGMLPAKLMTGHAVSENVHHRRRLPICCQDQKRKKTRSDRNTTICETRKDLRCPLPTLGADLRARTTAENDAKRANSASVGNYMASRHLPPLRRDWSHRLLSNTRRDASQAGDRSQGPWLDETIHRRIKMRTHELLRCSGGRHD